MVLIIYGLVGLSMKASAVMITLAALSLTNLTGCQNLILAVHVMPNQDTALVLAVTYTTFAMNLAGFFVWLTQLPKPLLWISYVTPMRYAFDLLVSQHLEVMALALPL
jgi:ABC-type multidrug transport system permease subunit